VKPLNYVVYEHILIKRVTEELKRTLTAVNVNRVFTQSLTLVLSCFIEAARTLLLNNIVILLYSLLILYVNYHHHELQQLLYKVTTHLNSYLQELQSMIHSYKKITNKRRSIKYC